MRDQAAELRSLVLRAARETRPTVGTLPRVQWIMGANPDVGATTLSVAMSRILAESGFRIVLVNGRTESETFARLTGTEPIDQQWLVRRKEIHEVMQVGRAGLQVVGSLGSLDLEDARGEKSNWLHRQLCTLRPYADLVMIETRFPDSSLSERMMNWANDALVVTTPLDQSVMNCYACIKEMAQSSATCRTSILINRTSHESEALEASQRIQGACQRFLEYVPELVGGLPDDEGLGAWLDRPLQDEERVEVPAVHALRQIALDVIGENRKKQSAA